MAVQAALPLAAADTLCCLGLGFLLAAWYDCCRFLLGDSRPVCFVLDMAGFLLAAILVCSFAAGKSAAGVVRWYMAAGLALGLAGYFRVLAPGSRALQRQIKWLLTRPAALLWILLLLPIGRLFGGIFGALIHMTAVKYKKCRKKQQQKQLQKQCEILYNSN